MSMRGKTVLITGGNCGIGKETALGLAQMGARIILGCRNLTTARQARDEIEKMTQNPEVVVRSLDLSSQKAVRAFAAEIRATEPHIDVLIHNAGIALLCGSYVTEDGVDETMATNHYGPFLLTHLLADLLRKRTPSRIVVVASTIYKMCLTFTIDPNPTGSLFPMQNYFYSKLANIRFTHELARRLEGSGVTVNCLHPGIVDSDIWNYLGYPLSNLLRWAMQGVFKTLKEGAETSIYVASSEALEGVSGQFFKDSAPGVLWNGVKNESAERLLWDQSVEMVNLSKEEEAGLGYK